MAIFPGSAIPSAVSDDYEIDNSLRFNQASALADTHRLTRTFSSAGNRKTWTFSCWYKPGLVDSSSKVILSASTEVFEYRLAGDVLQIWNGTTSPNDVVFTTSASYRDPASWYHFVLSVDTTQPTAANRVKIYVNGEQPVLSTYNAPNQNTEWQVNNSVEHNIGIFKRSNSANNPEAFDGYLADVYFIDGQALAADSFGELDSDTNQWKPLDSDDVKDAVIFGTNGFYQKYNSTELATSFTDVSQGWTCPDGVTSVDYLVVAGGGGGGGDKGGGGGAGGFRTGSLGVTPGVSYAITIGDGGAGNTSNQPGTDGGNSVFSSITSTGGGGGDGWLGGSGGRSGGSGGGGAQGTSGGAGTASQGYAGGSGSASNGAGGGGGASEVGANGDAAGAGNNVGGDGLSSSISGGAVTYAGGGGGGNDSAGSAGGAGGGGAGVLTGNGGNATGYGSGGGGGGTSGGNGGAGSSGIVIIDDGTTVSTFTSSSSSHTISVGGTVVNQRPQPHNVTANGDAHLIGPKVGTSVAEFQGTTSDRLSVAASSDFNFGTGDWTVEVFANKDQDLDASIYRFGDGSPLIELIIDENDKPKWYVENTSGSGYSADGADGDTELNRWYHLAAVKSGTTLTFYLNGVSKATATGLSGDFGNATDTTDIGSRGSAEKAFGGYMDSLRVSNSARYTENFTPPTTSFTNDSNTKLLIQNGTDGSQTFTDGSSSSHTITVNGDVRWFAPKVGAGAMAFDGTGDYFSVPDSISWYIGSSLWTAECWIKFNELPSSGNGMTFIAQNHNAISGNYTRLINDSGTYKWRWKVYTTSDSALMEFDATDSGLSANTWYHIAFVRESSSGCRIYRDGVSKGTGTLSGDPQDYNRAMEVGRWSSSSTSSTYLNGFIDGLRISKKAVYSGASSFTPPTTAFTDDVNTVLLLNADVNQGTWAEDTSTGLAISTDSSIDIGGGTNYLTAPSSDDWDFGTGEFTLEMWAKFDDAQAGSGSWGLISNNTGGSGWQWAYDMSDSKFHMWSTDQSAYEANAQTIVQGAWNHLAVTRQSDTIRFYFNGVEIGNSAFTETMSDTATTLQVFAYRSDGLGAIRSGQFDEIRVSNTNRYPDGTTFTPQTRGNPFTADANTKLLIHSDYTGGLGADSSGNYNAFTPTNLVVTDQMIDTPTNNFATMSPIDASWVYATGQTVGPPTFSEGNLKLSHTTGSDGYEQARGTIAVQSGKWYFEALLKTSTDTYQAVGIATTSTEALRHWGGQNAAQWVYQNNGNTINGSGADGGFSTYAAGDIISVAFDCDAGKLWWAKNGTWEGSGVPASGTNARYTNLATQIASDGNPVAAFNVLFDATSVWIYNFGSDSSFVAEKTAQGNQDGNEKGDFYYAPPSGFLALCADNLSAPEIALPGDNFNSVLYTGNGVDGRAITGVGFQPDWLWIKKRNATGAHNLVDSVRGPADSFLETNHSGAESTTPATVDSLDSDGFTVTDYANTNADTKTFVAWNWKAGGAPTADNSAGAGATPTAGSVKIDGSNLGSALAGSIAATRLSANTTSGFSIIKYTGTGSAATIAHGLSQAPDLWIVKNMDQDDNWIVGTTLSGAPATGALELNNTSDWGSGASYWNSTSPTASVINLGTYTSPSSEELICYAFHNIEGYSKVGSYSGNSADDGPFLFTSFKPAWVLIKCYAGGSHNQEWIMFDDERSPYNVVDDYIYADDNLVEASGSDRELDFVSNGIKFRGPGGPTNVTGRDYIYLAFAESPFKYSNAR